jgi:NAD(P)-dependent dehydrogenase (short-subunit alcohol dehydrogenase family)
MSWALHRLEGKVAIVSGAASGIGTATVELFRGVGAIVVGADLGDGADVRCDAGNEDEVKRLVERAADQHGRLDIFFANAGISGGSRPSPSRAPPTGPRSCASI